MHVKICGMTRAEDAVLAAQLGADFIGLIRAPSSRQVSLDVAISIARQAGATVGGQTHRTRPVLLYRDAPLEDVCAELERSGLDWVQLHGRESVALVENLVRRFPELHLIKAWEVAAAASVDDGADLADYLHEAAARGIRFDAVILDVPKNGPHPGYDRLGEVSRRCHGLADEFWCAGGLTEQNLAAAVRAGQYEGIDVSRGVESRPGVKDAELLRRFVDVARELRPQF
jgi:phosphoribosylanthranilate isomerase